MKKWITIALVLALSLSLFSVTALADTQGSLPEGDYDLEYYTRFKDQGMTLNVFNWGEYISDGTDDSLDVNKAFEELTGIKVNYNMFDTVGDVLPPRCV